MIEKLQERVSKRRLSAVDALPPVMAVFLLALVTSPLMRAQTFTTLYNFTGSTDGAYPYAGVVQDEVGNLYGVAANGGNLNCTFLGQPGCGVVFKLDTTGKETVLHSFSGKDGAYPYGTLVRDEEGNLYGTTEYGGDLHCDKYQGFGCGVAFKIDTTGKETVLHVFRGGRSDGCEPYQNLIMDEAGNLYGTTPGCGASSAGTVFKLSKGKETLLHNFAWSDGATPSGLLRDASGNFYGLTQQGGTWGHGVLYRLTKEGTLTVLHNFAGGAEGSNPVALTVGRLGNFYGTTNQGGSFGGTAWKVGKQGTETILHNFDGGTGDGCFPHGGVVRDSNGDLYGNTYQCGSSDAGIIWKVSKNGTETVLHNFSVPDGANPSGSLLRDAKGGLYGTTSCAYTGNGCYGTVWAYK